MSRRLIPILLCLFAVGSASAQTGKVTGTVTDLVSGEPLPGVNVVIEGTTQGASTGIDGKFIIIGVRPGVYDVLASFIGFSRQRREGVQVNVDLTTTVDFQMAEEVVEGEEIVVTAEAVAVRKDLTSSEARVTAETIDKLPVTELSQVLDVQAGVTTRNGIHIRGGRSSEVVFMVDGVPVSDSYDGSSVIQLENDGIEELQVISGTFNAEYGNAMSGIVNVVTKEGRSDRFSGSAQVYAGGYAVTGEGGADFLRGIRAEEYSRAGIQYRDIDPYSYLPFQADHFQNATVSLEGPIWKDRITFFALGRHFKNDGWLYGARLFGIDGSAGDSSLVPMNNFEKTSWQGNLKIRLSRKLILNVIGLGSFSRNRSYNLVRRWSPDGRYRSFDEGYDAKVKLTHLIGPRTFYTFNTGIFNREVKGYLYEDPLDPRYNDFDLVARDSVEYLPGQYIQVLSGGQRYARGGTNLSHFNRTSRSYFVKGDLSSQITDHHLIKTGLQVRIDELALTGFSLIPAFDETGQRFEPFQPAIPVESSVAYTTFSDLSPRTLSAYAQDKMEFDDFVVNAGVRFDYFDARARVPADPSDPNIFNPLKLTNRFRDTNGDGVIQPEEELPENALTRADREPYWWEDSSPKLQISPRLGAAWPITEQGVIHFSYGIFFQIPTQNRLFANFGFKMPALTGSYGPFGNPDLDAQKTTMYEIGLRQGFGGIVADITGYYRDVRNWVSTSQPIIAALPGINYVIYTNRDLCEHARADRAPVPPLRGPLRIRRQLHLSGGGRLQLEPCGRVFRHSQQQPAYPGAPASELGSAAQTGGRLLRRRGYVRRVDSIPVRIGVPVYAHLRFRGADRQRCAARISFQFAACLHHLRGGPEPVQGIRDGKGASPCLSRSVQPAGCPQCGHRIRRHGRAGRDAGPVAHRAVRSGMVRTSRSLPGAEESAAWRRGAVLMRRCLQYL